MAMESQEQELIRLRSENIALRSDNIDLRKRVSELEKLLIKLQERLGLDSSNSHKPSSTDLYKKKVVEKKVSKPRGGKLGHKGHHRELVENPDKITRVSVKNCSYCQSTVLKEKGYRRYQVWELPEIRTEVQEYRLSKSACYHCNKISTASLPAEVKGQFGARLSSLVGMLLTEYRHSTRKVRSFLSSVLNVKISAGGIEGIKKRIRDCLHKDYYNLMSKLREEPQLNMDETGWKIQNSEVRKPQAWLARSPTRSVYYICESRGSKIAHRLTGSSKYQGVLTTDRYGGYSKYVNRQICWSHLQRDFKRIAARPGKDGFYGGRLLYYTEHLFKHWHRYKRGEISLSECKDALKVFRKLVKLRLRTGSINAELTTSRTLQNILKLESHLWSFLEHAGIEPTNNAAERAIRPLVILRKITQGSQYVNTAAFVSSVMSIVESLKQQGRNVFEELTQAVNKAFAGEQNLLLKL